MAHERNKPRPRFWSFLFFALGVILGWLVLGWWLWPIEWMNVDPWQLSPDGQRAYLAAVAEGYALTGDVAVLQERLAGWDAEDLAQLLAFMIQETPNAAAQQLLNDLREALTLPQVNVTFLDLILGQKVIIVTLIAAAILLGGAVLVALYPSWQQARVTQLEAQRLADEAVEMAAAAVPTEVKETVSGNGATTGEETENAAAVNNTTQPTPTETENEQTGGGVAAAGSSTAQTNKGIPQATAEEQATAQVSTQPLVGARPNSQLNPGDQTNVEKLLEDTTGSIQELLSAVFDDEEKTAHFDILLKGIDDVDITELMMLAEQLRHQLRQQNEVTA